MLAYIGLGSNLEDPRRQIEKALDAIREANKTKLTSVSSFYESKPLLDIPGPKYLNAVCKIKTDLSALDLLDVCQQIESDQHRVREVKWGSRTIDLDILALWRSGFFNSKVDYTSPRNDKSIFCISALV